MIDVSGVVRGEDVNEDVVEFQDANCVGLEMVMGCEDGVMFCSDGLREGFCDEGAEKGPLEVVGTSPGGDEEFGRGDSEELKEAESSGGDVADRAGLATSLLSFSFSFRSRSMASVEAFRFDQRLPRSEKDPDEETEASRFLSAMCFSRACTTSGCLFFHARPLAVSPSLYYEVRLIYLLINLARHIPCSLRMDQHRDEAKDTPYLNCQPRQPTSTAVQQCRRETSA